MSETILNPKEFASETAGSREASVGYPNRKWLVLLAAATAVFYWKILFTGQFSIVEDWEAVNQGFVWHQFAVSTIKRGIFPLWDPYAFGGRSHIGEMQPGVFYPLKLLLYVWPLNSSGLLSWRLFEQYFVLAHLLAAIFMYLFALEAGLKSRFGAFIAAICFSFGGFLGIAGGNQLWDSAIWLPLVMLFVLRALRDVRRDRAALSACLAGLALSMTILAGGLHAAIMDAFVVVTASAYLSWQPEDLQLFLGTRERWARAALVVAIVGVVSFAAAAIQLFPSIEYAPTVVRWGGWGNALNKIPYSVLTENYYQPPRAIFAFIFATASYFPSEFAPYIGILPFLLAILGIWQCWRKPMVRYLAGLAVVVFVYSMGPFSLLHGFLYLLPLLDTAREAGRFIYLTHFALAVLAGTGAEVLLAPMAEQSRSLRKFGVALGTFTALVSAIFLIPTLYTKPEVGDWHYFSLLMLLASTGMFFYVRQGNTHAAVRFVMAALILCDLSAFNWGMKNRMDEEKQGRGYFNRLLSARPVADFFHSQPGFFRVQVETQGQSNISIGDMFDVQATGGQTATTSEDYLAVWGSSPQGACLTNIRYHLFDKDNGSNPVFASGPWRVYEDPKACPRAWVVHQTAVQASKEKIRALMEDSAFNPLQSAFVEQPLATSLDPAGEIPDRIRYTHYQEDGLEADIDASGRGLAVLSEMYYPGWTATLNGKPVPIHRVDTLLRGVEVSPGRNHLVMLYRPKSVLYGAILSGLAFVGTLALGIGLWFRERRSAAQ